MCIRDRRNPWHMSNISALQCCISDMLCAVISADGCSLPPRDFSFLSHIQRFCRRIMNMTICLTYRITDICLEGCTDLQSWMFMEIWHRTAQACDDAAIYVRQCKADEWISDLTLQSLWVKLLPLSAAETHSHHLLLTAGSIPMFLTAIHGISLVCI